MRGVGTVVTWGDADDGGDSSAVQAQLKNVHLTALLLPWVLLGMLATVSLCRISCVPQHICSLSSLSDGTFPAWGQC